MPQVEALHLTPWVRFTFVRESTGKRLEISACIGSVRVWNESEWLITGAHYKSGTDWGRKWEMLPIKRSLLFPVRTNQHGVVYTLSQNNLLVFILWTTSLWSWRRDYPCKIRFVETLGVQGHFSACFVEFGSPTVFYFFMFLNIR